MMEQTQVINLVDGILKKAVERGASDIHLEPEKNKFICRYRIDGILYKISEFPANLLDGVLSRIKIMADMDIAEKRLPQDGRFGIEILGKPIDMRVSTFPTINGENMVIRILDRSKGLLNLSELGFSKKEYELFNELIHRPYGMILVVGPTGSGKTTTLYAALSSINAIEKNILTLEDPIEYELPHIRQSQINIKAGLTFATGLRSMVRQDPDIIMIGEIRDRETAEIAIHAALTGHLVFSTLHTNDAPSAAIRLIDMGIEPFLITASLIGVLAQRLMRTLCPDCKKGYTPPEEILRGLSQDLQSEACRIGTVPGEKAITFYKETGCPQCSQTGYSGRTGIFELLIPDDAIRELIIQKKSHSIIREKARAVGMNTLRQAGIEKVCNGTTSISELLRVTE